MDKNTQKNLVIALIKDDLISSKLVSGLNQLGLDALHYHLHLSETVFELMGFPEDVSSEPIFEYYLKELDKAEHFNINGSHDEFDQLALSIYNELERRKPNA